MLLGNEAVAAMIGAVASGIVTYYISKKREEYRREERFGDRLSTLETTIQGQEGSQIVSGVTDVVEMHDQELESIGERLENIEEKAKERVERIEELESDIQTLKERSRKRQNGN